MDCLEDLKIMSNETKVELRLEMNDRRSMKIFERKRITREPKFIADYCAAITSF